MLVKKIRLEKALEKEEPLPVVKECFIEYREAYKRLRNPSSSHTKDYENFLIKFDKYEREHK